MQNTTDPQPSSELILAVDRDLDSIEALRVVAAHLGCSLIATDSLEGVRKVLSERRPTIAMLGFDCMDLDGFAALEALAACEVQPAALLLGSGDARQLASARRAAESRGLAVVGAISRPIDAVAVERLLAPYLTTPPRVSLAELEKAISEHELVLAYLPKATISLGGVRIQGVEALVRWQHPRRGLLMPGDFLHAVNEYGLMTHLTDFVMTEAFRQVGIWQEAGLSLEIVVNLNARLVQDRQFPERLARLLNQHLVPAERLIFDITEVSDTEDRALMLDVLRRLRILGVGLSLDNFGVAAASLAEIYRFPISEIKVDRSLIADLPREHQAAVVMHSLANLAHALHLKVCAAGVETRQMLESVRAAGFDSAQGLFFSGPVQAGEIERLVRGWPSFGPSETGSWRVRPSPAIRTS